MKAVLLPMAVFFLLALMVTITIVMMMMMMIMKRHIRDIIVSADNSPIGNDIVINECTNNLLLTM